MPRPGILPDSSTEGLPTCTIAGGKSNLASLMQVKVSRRTSIAAEGDKDLLSNIAEDLQGEEVLHSLEQTCLERPDLVCHLSHQHIG